jgi:hypothetical protein
MAEETLPLRPAITGLKLNEVTEFPIHRMASVKTSCSELSLIYNRKFKTKLDRDKGIIFVTRIK